MNENLEKIATTHRRNLRGHLNSIPFLALMLFGMLLSAASGQSSLYRQVKTLILPMDFSDVPVSTGDTNYLNYLQGITEEGRQYWLRHSYGNIDIDYTILDEVLELPGAAASYTGINQIADGSKALARAKGFNPDSYDVIVYFFAGGAPVSGVGGLGLGGSLWMGGNTPLASGFIHEYGHSINLGHAGLLVGGTDGNRRVYPGSFKDGSDGMVMMGSDNQAPGRVRYPVPASEAGQPRADFSSINLAMRWKLGAVGLSEVPVVNSDGIVRINEMELDTLPSSGIQGVQFRYAGEDWFVSFNPKHSIRWADHDPVGFNDGIIVQSLKGEITRLVDFTPGSAGNASNLAYVDTRDGALRVGSEYNFPPDGLGSNGPKLTPLSTGTANGVRYIDVMMSDLSGGSNITSVLASAGNTTTASGGSNWFGNRNPPQWRNRTAQLGIYSADEDASAPNNDYLRIKTTLTGLTPGASYNVAIDYAAKGEWGILAGLSQSSLQGFASSSRQIGVNFHIGANDSSGRVLNTGESTGNTPIFRGSLGVATANATGQITVYVDDSDNSGVNPPDRHRAWYRGLSYSLAPVAEPDPTFVSPSPADNSNLVAGSDIAIKVEAPSSTSNVRLFRNGTLVSQKGAAPFEWNTSGQNDPLLRNLPAGIYNFRADVTSTNGSLMSVDLQITVITPIGSAPPVGSLLASSANTTTASGDSNWFGGRTPPLWRDRSADLGVYSADEDTGEYATIKTTVSGLTPGASYKMTLDYGARQSWGILAGLSESSLEGFAASNVQIGSNSHIGLDDASGRVINTGDLTGNIPLFKGELGVAVANSAGKIDVYIDDSDNGTSGNPDSNRAWYRGVSYEITSGSGSGSGSGIDPVEVLASIANTTTAGGDATWSGGRTPPLWRDRSSNLGVFSADEDRFGTNNDFLRIKTTLSGLAPGGSYRIALDYGAKQTWGILAGLSESSLQGFAAANVQIGSNAHIGLDDASGRVTDSGNLAGDVPIYKADLGIAVANSAGQIAVYIDDADNGGSGNPDLNRAWYRGLTYQSVSGGGNTGGGNTGGGNTGGGSAGSPNFTQTRVNSVSNQSWTNVDLGQSYSSAVIVASPIYVNNSTPPVVARVRNVSGSGFQVKLDRADGQTGAVNLDVSIIAVEEGVYTQAADGVKMEAVKYTSSVTAGKGSWTSDSRSYQNSYTTPVVVGQVMSANDADWSVFWSRGATRASAPDSGNLNVGKQVASDPDRTRANETIGYIVIESGSGNIAGRGYSAGLGSDTVRGVVNSSTGYSYNVSGLSSASAAAVSISGIDGGDGGWAVLFGATAIRANGLTLAVDEDQLGDSERRHTTEQVGYLILE